MTIQGNINAIEMPDGTFKASASCEGGEKIETFGKFTTEEEAFNAAEIELNRLIEIRDAAHSAYLLNFKNAYQ